MQTGNDDRRVVGGDANAKKEILLFFIIAGLLLSGCTTKTDQKVQQNTEDSGSTDTSAAEIDTSDMFSDRDKEVGYEEAESVEVQLADNGSFSQSDAVSVENNTVKIKEKGTYILSGSLTDGMVIVEAEDTDKIQLVLDGVAISSSRSAALYVRSADKVFVTSVSGTENSLENAGPYDAIDENSIDAAVFSKSDLTFNGEGTLKISAQEGHGIVSKDDLIFTSGNYMVTSAAHGISGKDSVRIASGFYTIVSGKDGIHAENADDSSLGFVYAAGGTFSIKAEQDGISAGAWMQIEEGNYSIDSQDDGIHADSNVSISGGTINIEKSYEGIEGLSIDISGGEIFAVSSDDGINAAGGNDSSGFEGPAGEDPFAVTEGAYIKITGGTLHVNTYGDGLDSNGDIKITEGEIYVSGPVNDGNGTLDYSGNAEITGGIFAAAGSSGMAQNFNASSNQGCIMVNFDAQEAGTEIMLSDSSGNELLSWAADKRYSSVIISCPEIRQGETYTVKSGTAEQIVTMNSLIYGNNSPTGENSGYGRGKGSGEENKMQNRPELGQQRVYKENP